MPGSLKWLQFLISDLVIRAVWVLLRKIQICLFANHESCLRTPQLDLYFFRTAEEESYWEVNKGSGRSDI